MNPQLLETYKRIVADPWEFLRLCVVTIDQVDKVNPIKAFPAHLKYLELYTRVWQRSSKIVVPKSRRMFMSWVNIALHLWDTMFHEARLNAIVSKKEDDANELIDRAFLIYQNIPENVIPREVLPKAVKTFNNLQFPEIKSALQGFPQGADQLRQYTFSSIFADEMAFWEHAQKMYASSYPTLEGGGRFTGVSSPGPGFFKRLVFDQLDTGDDDVIIPPNRHYPMKGVEVWENPKNKFTVFQLHYSANPAKRDAGYRENIKSSMPIRQYNQEYELIWDSFEGKPVYADWNEQIHCGDNLGPELGLPLLRGWDFGLTPACVIGQLQGNQLVILKEYIGNRGIDIFSRQVLERCAIDFPGWQDQGKDWMNFVDPAGFKRSETDESKCVQIMYQNGVRKIYPGAMFWEPRLAAVNKYLTSMTSDGPSFQIDRNNCPVLVRGFNGGYRYADRRENIESDRERPLKDEHSHPHDALQYLASCVSPQKRGMLGAYVPTPKYAWSKGQGGLVIPKLLNGGS